MRRRQSGWDEGRGDGAGVWGVQGNRPGRSALVRGTRAAAPPDGGRVVPSPAGTALRRVAGSKPPSRQETREKGKADQGRTTCSAFDIAAGRISGPGSETSHWK